MWAAACLGNSARCGRRCKSAWVGRDWASFCHFVMTKANADSKVAKAQLKKLPESEAYKQLKYSSTGMATYDCRLWKPWMEINGILKADIRGTWMVWEQKMFVQMWRAWRWNGRKLMKCRRLMLWLWDENAGRENEDWHDAQHGRWAWREHQPYLRRACVPLVAAPKRRRFRSCGIAFDEFRRPQDGAQKAASERALSMRSSWGQVSRQWQKDLAKEIEEIRAMEKLGNPFRHLSAAVSAAGKVMEDTVLGGKSNKSKLWRLLEFKALTFADLGSMLTVSSPTWEMWFLRMFLFVFVCLRGQFLFQRGVERHPWFDRLNQSSWLNSLLAVGSPVDAEAAS